MLSEMELGDENGSEDGGGPAHEEGRWEEEKEEIPTDDYHNPEYNNRTSSSGSGRVMSTMTSSGAWTDVTRLGADLNRRIESIHTSGVADKVTNWMKGLVMTADEPDAVYMRYRAHDTMITQDHGEPSINVTTGSTSIGDADGIEQFNETYSDGDEVLVGGPPSADKETTMNIDGVAMDTLRSDQYVMSKKNRDAIAEAVRSRAYVEKLGTVKGVFLPCVQTIMGIIVFIRLPYITGQAGIWFATLIIFLCKLTTLLTTLSMSAIATNGSIQGGGPYYIISRNLGVELGGAIGTLFYFGLTASSTLYILGAVETINDMGGIHFDKSIYSTLIAMAIMVLLTVMVGVGVKYVNMSAAFFLLAVLLSLLFILCGALLFSLKVYSGFLSKDDWVLGDNLTPVWRKADSTDTSFYSLLAILFPSCTGIMAGTNRSGVLRTPSKSIPIGTLSAIGVTTCVYLLIVFIFGCFVSNEMLVSNKMVELDVSWPKPFRVLVAIGVIFSSFGAALQGLLGGSRLLLAISSDGTIPALRYLVPKSDKDPYLAVCLTGLIATLLCLTGSLDSIAPCATMFFLLMYACVNLSCFFLTVLRSPGFRPRWKYYSWFTAILGVVMCLAFMILISWRWAIASMFLALGLLVYIKYQNASKDWGDALAGFRYQIARDMLLTMQKDADVHAKNWRPQVLAFVDIDRAGNPTEPELLSLAGQMKMGGRGLLLVAGLLKGDPVEEADRAEEARRVLSMHLEDENIEGFAAVSVCPDPTEASVTVMHHSGIGTMQPNAVLISWPDDWTKKKERGIAFVKLLRGAIRAKRAVMIIKGAIALPSQFEKLTNENTIDIWWVSEDGGLLLLIPYLLTLHPVWRCCRLRLFAVTMNPDDDLSRLESEVYVYLEEVRISAEVQVVNLSDMEANRRSFQEEMVSRQKAQEANNIGVLSMMLPSNTSAASHGMLPHSVSVNNYEEQEELECEELPSLPSKEDGDQFFNDKVVADNSEEQPDVRRRLGNSHLMEFKDVHEKDRNVMAVVLNQRMKMADSEEQTRLVVTNMALPIRSNALEVLRHVETFTEGLYPVLLIRGSNHEVITAFG